MLSLPFSLLAEPATLYFYLAGLKGSSTELQTLQAPKAVLAVSEYF